MSPTPSPATMISNISPLTHAIGGSIGSALSLFLFYPLERARIEMQSAAMAAPPPSSSSSSSSASSPPRQEVKEDEGANDDDERLPEEPDSSCTRGTDRVKAVELAEQEVVEKNRMTLIQVVHASTQQQTEQDQLVPITSTVSPLKNPTIHWQEQPQKQPQDTMLIEGVRQNESWSLVSGTSNQRKNELFQERPPTDEDADALWSLCPSSSSTTTTSIAPPPPAAATGTTRRIPQHKTNNYDSSTKISLAECLKCLWERNELYRGVGPVVFTLASSNFVFFYLNALMRRLVVRTSNRRNGITSPHVSNTWTGSSYQLLLASCLAGIANVLITNPLWVVNLRIVAGDTSSPNNKNNNNMWQELLHIVRQEGLKHLWNGTVTSLLLVSNPVIQFFAYEEMRSILLSRKLAAVRSQVAAAAAAAPTTPAASLHGLEIFMIGALAKAIATVSTYPLQLAQVLLRLQHDNINKKESDNKSVDANAASTTTSWDHEGQNNNNHNDNNNNKNHKDANRHCRGAHYRGTWDCLVRLYQRDGIEGLFTGMRAKLLQTVLTAAFTFLTYEQILKALNATRVALMIQYHNN